MRKTACRRAEEIPKPMLRDVPARCSEKSPLSIPVRFPANVFTPCVAPLPLPRIRSPPNCFQRHTRTLLISAYISPNIVLARSYHISLLNIQGLGGSRASRCNKFLPSSISFARPPFPITTARAQPCVTNPSAAQADGLFARSVCLISFLVPCSSARNVTIPSRSPPPPPPSPPPSLPPPPRGCRRCAVYRSRSMLARRVK